MNDRDAAVRIAAGLLLASGFRRIENSSLRAARESTLRRLAATGSTWRRRSGNAIGAASVGIGGLVLLHQYRSLLATRDLAHRADGPSEPATQRPPT
jgi:hypothetical protein